MTVTVLEIPGTPVPKGRPRSGRGNTFTPRRTVEYEQLVAWHARAQRIRLGAGPVELQADFYTRKGGGDLDNLLKSLLDGLVKGGAIDDDAPHIVSKITVRWHHDPRNERCHVRLIHPAD